MVVQKLSDIVADFISIKSLRNVFAISGGASLHLIHSISNHPKLIIFAIIMSKHLLCRLMLIQELLVILVFYRN